VTSHPDEVEQWMIGNGADTRAIQLHEARDVIRGIGQHMIATPGTRRNLGAFIKDTVLRLRRNKIVLLRILVPGDDYDSIRHHNSSMAWNRMLEREISLYDATDIRKRYSYYRITLAFRESVQDDLRAHIRTILQTKEDLERFEALNWETPTAEDLASIAQP
jgi:hypothetical protein